MRIIATAMLAFAVMAGWAAGGDKRPSTGKTAAAPAVEAEPADWRQPGESAGTIMIPRGPNGHFMIGGDVAGTPLRFVVDTGATTVAIGREDARRIGIDPAGLAFDHEGKTAAGSTRYAAVTLPRLRIGDIQLLNVRTAVLDVPETMPLLGQSFLGRIEKVSIEGDQMTLTKL